MGQKSMHFSILSVFISLLFCGSAFSLCYETAGGKLQSGSITKYIPSILQSYEKDVPDGAIYTVQKKQGYYFKICNESVQIKHFMEKWAYPEVSKGEWKKILITKEKPKIGIINEIGIYKISQESGNWVIWSFAEKGTEQENEEVKAKPATHQKQDNALMELDEGLRRRVKNLSSKDPVVRGKNAYELGEFGEKAKPAIPYLLNILDDRASLQWGNPLSAEMEMTTPGEEAAKSIAKIDFDSLVAAFQKGNRDVRLTLTEAFADIPGERTVDILLEALANSKDEFIANQAALSLGGTGNVRAVPLLNQTLLDKDRDRQTRVHCTSALRSLGDKRAVPPLICALSDPEPSIRSFAAKALGKLKDNRAIGPLIDALADTDHYGYVRQSASYSLFEITGKKFGEDQQKWRSWYQTNNQK